MKVWGPISQARLAAYWKAGMPVDDIRKMLRCHSIAQITGAARKFGLGPHPFPRAPGPKVGSKRKKYKARTPAPAAPKSAKPNQIKFRQCLSCHSSFGSRGSYERICQPCKKRESWQDNGLTV